MGKGRATHGQGRHLLALQALLQSIHSLSAVVAVDGTHQVAMGEPITDGWTPPLDIYEGCLPGLAVRPGREGPLLIDMQTMALEASLSAAIKPMLLVQAPGTWTTSRAASLAMWTRKGTAMWTVETWQPRRSAFCEVCVLLEGGKDCMAAEMQPTWRGEALLSACWHCCNGADMQPACMVG